MSRNKDIEFLHCITQKPYKECRQLMKKHHWNVVDALTDTDVLEWMNDLTEMIPKILEDLLNAIKPVAEACVKLAKRYMEGMKELHLDNRDVKIEKLDDKYCMPYVEFGNVSEVSDEQT